VVDASFDYTLKFYGCRCFATPVTVSLILFVAVWPDLARFDQTKFCRILAALHRGAGYRACFVLVLCLFCAEISFL
jgi:hypothetical protein